MTRSLRKAMSLAEIVGVMVMLGVLCVAITPHFLQAGKASQLSKLRFNLQKLREKVEAFRTKNGQPPLELQEALDAGEPMPENPFSTAAHPHLRSRVKQIASQSPGSRDITPWEEGGWLYNPASGAIWPDHSLYLDE